MIINPIREFHIALQSKLKGGGDNSYIGESTFKLLLQNENDQSYIAEWTDPNQQSNNWTEKPN